MWEEEKKNAWILIRIFTVIFVIVVVLNLYFGIKREVDMALNPYVYFRGTGSAGTHGFGYIEDENIIKEIEYESSNFNYIENTRIHILGLSNGTTDVYIFVFAGWGSFERIEHFRVHNFGSWMHVVKLDDIYAEELNRLKPDWFTIFLKKGIKEDGEYDRMDFDEDLFKHRYWAR